MARDHVQVQPAGLVRGEQDRRAEALDLQRPAGLVVDARPEPVRREDGERQDDDRDGQSGRAEAEEGLAPAAPPPDIRERGRDEHAREDLRREADPERGEAEPLPPAEDRSEAGDRERGRPDVVAVDQHRAEGERR
ncbi:MAG TPA: hypothetical protein VEG40_10515, partial [Gaiellaceae bacterium]|nr:hypothetical protein [Gaiellaceae bacterium]